MLSVTQILRPYQDFSRVPPDKLECAAQRGRTVHAFCADIARGTAFLKPPTEALGYVDCFKEWFTEYVLEVHSVEEEYVDEAFGFVGHPDLVVTIRGDKSPSVWDLKTPLVESRTWCAQLAAYLHLVKQRFDDVRWCAALQLYPGRKARAIPYTESDEHFTAFLSALNAVRYFKGE
jgi:hypothetical protein